MSAKHNLAVIVKQPENHGVVLNASGTKTSYAWVLNKKNIGNLLGGRFSIHPAQKTMSIDQGTIVGVNFHHSNGRDRVAIEFRPDNNSVDGSLFSWGQEKAYW